MVLFNFSPFSNLSPPKILPFFLDERPNFPATSFLEGVILKLCLKSVGQIWKKNSLELAWVNTIKEQDMWWVLHSIVVARGIL